MAEAETQALCEEGQDGCVAELRPLETVLRGPERGGGDPDASGLRDWEHFVSFYHYPKEHWVHSRRVGTTA